MCYTSAMIVHIETLRWDSWNIAHIARHAVVPEEVEAVCRGPAIARTTYDKRILIIGPTAKGRLLAVVLAPENAGHWYPITARPASRAERRIYRIEQGGEEL